MLVMNATDKEQSARAFGNWFSFKPGQIKNIRDEFAAFIVENKAYQGFVSLPGDAEDPEYLKSDQGKADILAAKKTGMNNWINHLTMVASNSIVSLKQDLDKKNMKADPASFMSDGELQALQELARYQDKDQDEQAARVDEINKLAAKLSIGKK